MRTTHSASAWQPWRARVGSLVLLMAALARPGWGQITQTPAQLRLDVTTARVVRVPVAEPAGPVAPDAPSDTVTETIFQDDFEGSFPGAWYRRPGSTAAYWGATSHRAFSGTHSAYCAAGGDQPVPTGGPYLPGMATWLIYGPFSTLDASAAQVELSYYLDCEPKSDDTYLDYLFFGVAVDGINFSGVTLAGRDQVWKTSTYGLATDRDNVWFAIVFASNATNEYEGAYVDKVTISRTLIPYCYVSCSATVPTTTSYASAVTFQGTATASNCTEAVGITWAFGDGSTNGSGAAVTHTYSTPGTYTWTMTARANYVTCTRSGTITVIGPCEVACAASVPTTSQVGAANLFRVSVSSSAGCSGVVSTLWSFGDGSAGSTSQTPSHAYAAPGTYTWSVTATSGSVTCSRTGTITVTDGGTAYSDAIWVPVVTHAGGAGGSQWRTDLGILNVGAEPARVELKLQAGENPPVRATEVGPGVQSILADVVGQLAFTGSGAMLLRSDRPVQVTSRTYNQAAEGTFGQGYECVASEAGTLAGEAVFLPGLLENAAYRTNIAVTNTGAVDAAVTVELHDGNGVTIGQYPVLLRPGQWKQENQPFWRWAGRMDLDRGWASVGVISGSGILAYASVIDNTTNDPTTVGMKRAPDGSETTTWVPVAAHAPGVSGSKWRTDLGLLNPGTASATVELTLHGAAPIAPVTVVLAAREQAVLVDVVDRFGATGTGSLQVTADQPVIVTSRTYNQTTSGTYGQDYDGVPASQGVAAGQTFVLPQLTESPSYRTNIGLANLGSTTASARVALYNGVGLELGEYRVDLAPGQVKQETQPFRGRADQTDMPSGWARVTATAGDSLIGYASVVDNRTNDPTTVSMKRLPSPTAGPGLVLGRVRDGAGNPVAGATVSVNGLTMVTGDKGYYSLPPVPASPRAVVAVARAGLAPGSAVTKVVEGESHQVDITVLPIGTNATLDATTGGTVATPEGGTATLPGAAFVTETGGAFSGMATVSLTVLDPSVPSLLEAFPGETAGVTLDGQLVPLGTFGLATVTATDGANPLQLAPGKTATLEVPIPVAFAASAPASLPSWWFDAALGTWHEIGTFVWHDGRYRTVVPRLGTWAVAGVTPHCTASGRAVDSTGDPVEGARVRVRGFSSTGGASVSGESFTGEAGTFSVTVAADAELDIAASKGEIVGNHVAVHSCLTGGVMSVGDLALGGSDGTGVATITLRWGANPRDLDAHLVIPEGSGMWGHLFYGARSVDACTLATETTTGVGPEVVRILSGRPGTYRFSVHHWVGSESIATSGAVVTLQAEGLGVRTFTPGPGATGAKDVWHVFDLVWANGAFTVTPLGDYLHNVASAGNLDAFKP